MQCNLKILLMAAIFRAFRIRVCGVAVGIIQRQLQRFNLISFNLAEDMHNSSAFPN